MFSANSNGFGADPRGDSYWSTREGQFMLSRHLDAFVVEGHGEPARCETGELKWALSWKIIRRLPMAIFNISAQGSHPGGPGRKAGRGSDLPFTADVPRTNYASERLL